jgi:hypothetical protein
VLCALVGSAVVARGASAEPSADSTCHPLCLPSITLIPTLLRTHLFDGPRVEKLSTGATRRLPSASHLEIIVAASAKTIVPRVTLFGSVQWLPNATEAANPFTEYTASDLGGPVRANAPTATVGLSAEVLTAKEAHGIADVAINVGDLFSQAAQPDDRSSFTGKLDLALLTHWHVFASTPPATYINRVTLVGMLDYVATGLPHAGDEVPKGRRFLSDARPTSLLLGLSLPLTPKVP